LVLKQNNEFQKIATYGNKNWQKISVKIGAWFVTGEIKYFESLDEALLWINN